MRCYFMRNGHIEAVEELFGLSEEEATAKTHALFQSANTYLKASSCGITLVF
jgi:hypothetical protein